MDETKRLDFRKLRKTITKNYSFVARWYAGLSFVALLFPNLTITQFLATTNHGIAQIHTLHAPAINIPHISHGGDNNDD